MGDEYGLARIVPRRYSPDRTKQSSAIVEIFDVKLWDRMAMQLLGVELYERMVAAREVVEGIEIPHYKKPYPFKWSLIA